MDRRSVMISAVAALVAARSTRVLAQGNGASGALNTLFDQFMKENLDLSPLTVTELGLDTGERAHQKSEIDDTSLAGVAKGKAVTAVSWRVCRHSTVNRSVPLTPSATTS